MVTCYDVINFWLFVEFFCAKVVNATLTEGRDF